MALNENKLIAAETRRQIHQIAARMGYVRNPVVANLMSQLSQSRTKTYKATLALLNIGKNADAYSGKGAVHDWVKGCEKRAAELGYRLDRFWLYDRDLTPAKLSRILRARGISGVLIINSGAAPGLLHQYDGVLSTCSCMVVGNRITDPPLNFVCNDQYLTSLETVRKLAALGFKRPGFIMCRNLDELVEMKFSAGYQKGFELMYTTSPVPVIAPAKHEIYVFEHWLNSQKPDVVIAVNDWPHHWLNKLNISVPEEMRLVNLDWRAEMTDWAGMDQNSEMIGATAVEQLIAQIHRNERGIPEVAKCVLIQSTWRSGESLMAV